MFVKGFSADPIDDNIYHWRVKMFNFDDQSAIGKQLAEIEKAYDYVCIE
jgi:baculoviral IAP repeat-containing protein 6